MGAAQGLRRRGWDGAGRTDRRTLVKLSSARALIALSGRTFLPLGLLAKLPLAMGQLGVLLLVADRTGSYTTGGAAAAAIGVGSAVGAPVGGAAADRFGQRPVLLACGVAHAIGLVALVLLSRAAASTSVLLGVAGLAGLFAPQVGPLARVRWVALVRGRVPADLERRRISEAFAVEGATDEASFVAGPALVGVLATLAGPQLAPLVTAGLAVTAVVAFGLHPTARLVPPHRSRPAGAHPPRRGLPGGRTTVLLLVAGGLLGLVFGGTQVGVTSLTTSLGRPGAAGLVYGLLGVGSAVAGLASAGLPARFGLADRLIAFAAALALLAAPLLLVDRLGTLAAAVALLGCSVAPYLIVLYALAERAAPVERAATVMTLLSSAVVVGYAAGSSSAGALADAGGHRWAFAVPVAAGWCAVLLAWAARRRFDRLAPSVVSSTSASSRSPSR